MILGQLLDGVSATTTTYYSPWFPRGGNLAKFTCQVFAFDGLSGGGEKLQIGVETKNSEESDKDAVLMSGTPVNITLTILASTTWEAGANLSSANPGFKELVRFKYQIVSTSEGAEPWVHIRVLNPVWLSN